MEIKSLMVQQGDKISNALRVITRESSGFCYVMSGQKLVGIITDGDIRRAFLNGSTVNDSVDVAMTKKFHSLRVGATLDEIQKNVVIYKNIPILNDNGDLVDVATPNRYHQIPLVQPVFDGRELEYITDCILTGWISSQGKYVKEFESNFSRYIGVNNALAVPNGTVALHLALVALGIGPGDEVLVPNLTFAAPMNAVLYVGATPVLVDVDSDSMTIDIEMAKRLVSIKTRAIIAVHLYGHPANMSLLESLASSNNLYIVEDCAEALGSKYQGKNIGTFGDVATFSFFGNKTLTTGEGGMVLFQDSSIYSKAKVLRDHGMSPERRYWHDEIGFNYRLTNLQAAVGVAQLERLDYFVERKRWVADQYNSLLKNCTQLRLPPDGGDIHNSYWLYTVVLAPELSSCRNTIIKLLQNYGIEARPTFFPLHRMPIYKKYSNGDHAFPASNWLADCGISLPSSITLTLAEIIQTCEFLKEAITISAASVRV